MAVLTAVSLLAAGRAPDGRCASEPTEPWSFQVAETEAYRRDVPDAEAHLLDAGCRASSSLAPAAGSGRWPRTDPPGQAGVVKIRPRAANSSVWASVQQDSVSTSVPSQSNATACGIHPSNGQGRVIRGNGALSGRRRRTGRSGRDVRGIRQRAGRDGSIRAFRVLPPSRRGGENDLERLQTVAVVGCSHPRTRRGFRRGYRRTMCAWT
jgi:hypothetical protein